MDDLLGDTNFFISLVLSTRPNHAVARQALRTVRARGGTVFITAQNLTEFMATAIRPIDRRGLGLTFEHARNYVELFLIGFPLLDEHSGWFAIWHEFLKQKAFTDAVYDARLAAVAKASGISSVLTFNVNDFRGLPGVQPIDPATLR